jgi:hypothetical protein
MNTTNKIGLVLEINLISGFYYRGVCLDETSQGVIIRDKNGDRIEIAKAAILVCKEVRV